MQTNGATVVPEISFTPILERKAATANARRNLAQGYPRLHQLPEAGKPKASAIALVGGGPSLQGRIDALRGFRTIMACSTVHDYLIGNGIFPRYAVIMDPVAAGNLHYFRFLSDTCTYLVASHVEPAVLARFGGYPVALWNAMGEAEAKVFGAEPQIMGGCTAMLRAMILALYLGWSDQHLFGMDSCYVAGDSHAYKVAEAMPEARKITVQGGREFLTTAAWVLQARQFFDTLVATQGAFRPTIHGDGLVAEMVRCGNPELHRHIRLA